MSYTMPQHIEQQLVREKRHVDAMLHRALVSSDAPLKIALYAGAIFWALFLLLPGNMLGRPIYHLMYGLAPPGSWAFAFSGYAAIGLIRSLTPCLIRPGIALAHNTLGAALWCGTTSLCMFSVMPPGGLMVGNLILSAAALWILLRTPFLPVGD